MYLTKCKLWPTYCPRSLLCVTGLVSCSNVSVVWMANRVYHHVSFNQWEQRKGHNWPIRGLEIDLMLIPVAQVSGLVDNISQKFCFIWSRKVLPFLCLKLSHLSGFPIWLNQFKRSIIISGIIRVIFMEDHIIRPFRSLCTYLVFSGCGLP